MNIRESKGHFVKLLKILCSMDTSLLETQLRTGIPQVTTSIYARMQVYMLTHMWMYSCTHVYMHIHHLILGIEYQSSSDSEQEGENDGNDGGETAASATGGGAEPDPEQENEHSLYDMVG